MYHVYSTLGQDNVYTGYRSTHDLPVAESRIVIYGGTGVINKNLITPHGILTSISDEDYEILKKNHDFNRHVENGFIVVQKQQEKVEKVVKSMQPKDGSAQLTPEDFKKSDNPIMIEGEHRAAIPSDKKGK